MAFNYFVEKAVIISYSFHYLTNTKKENGDVMVELVDGTMAFEGGARIDATNTTIKLPPEKQTAPTPLPVDPAAIAALRKKIAAISNDRGHIDFPQEKPPATIGLDPNTPPANDETLQAFFAPNSTVKTPGDSVLTVTNEIKTFITDLGNIKARFTSTMNDLKQNLGSNNAEGTDTTIKAAAELSLSINTYIGNAINNAGSLNEEERKKVTQDVIEINPMLEAINEDLKNGSHDTELHSNNLQRLSTRIKNFNAAILAKIDQQQIRPAG